MSTPNMSGRSDDASTPDDHLDPSDLLNEDGTVNLSQVRSIANAANGANETITPARCAKIRDHLCGRVKADATGEKFNHGHTAIRRHAKGECYHDERLVDHPPLRYVRGDRWRVDE